MRDSRRDFLGKAAGGVLALYSAPLLTGCSGAIRNKIAYNPSSNDNSLKIDKNIAAILHYASLAPSGHNAQPWSVKLNSPLEWIICADPKRRLPAVDPDNRSLLLSIGAFLENLSIAARIHGFEADIKIIAENASDTMIAKATLQTAKPVDYPLDRITKRRTVRKGLLPDKLKQNDIQALSETSEGNIFYIPRSQSKHSQCIEEAQVESYRVQTHRSEASEELKSWFRLSDQEARKYNDGLTTEGMEITGIQGWYIRHFMTPEDMSSNFSKKMSIAMNEEFVKQGAGWFVITSKSHHVADIIEAGRKFERMALIARERKIALAPMTQLLEEKTGRDIIASHHGAQMIPQMVLRVGYLDRYPDPVSLRRPVSWFVMD